MNQLTELQKKQITFHWAKGHNPHFNIVLFQYDEDTSITYCIPVDGSKSCEVFEVYVGSNYNINSDKSSYSRAYKIEGNFNSVPKRWAYLAKQLKAYLVESLSKLNEVGIDHDTAAELDRIGLGDIWKNELK